MLRAGRAAEPEALEIGVSGPEQRAEIEEIWAPLSRRIPRRRAPCFWTGSFLADIVCPVRSAAGRSPWPSCFPRSWRPGRRYCRCSIFSRRQLSRPVGWGLFGRLLRQALERAREQGIAASFLRPAEPGLAAYYERFGYRPFFRSAAERVSRETFHPAGRCRPAGLPCWRTSGTRRPSGTRRWRGIPSGCAGRMSWRLWPPTRPFYPAAEPLPERAASLCANRREIRCLSGIGAAGRRRKGTPRGGGGALSPAGNRAFPLRPRRGRGAPSAGFVR